MNIAEFSTAIGRCRLAWNEAGLTRFWLPEESSGSGTADSVPRDAPEWVRSLVARIQEHLTGHPQRFGDAPIDWTQVSDFQRRVYEQTVAIAPGTVRSYGELAHALGLGREGARAVGVALATNPWPLVVPCHRVVAANGRMTGFSGPGGVRTKTRLLAIEGAELLSE